MTTYHVDYWGSHPDAGNDDCWAGYDFETLAEAMEHYRAAPWHPRCKDCTAFVELTGPGVREVRANPLYRPAPADDGEWRREAARQAGMAHGVQGWNDYHG